MSRFPVADIRSVDLGTPDLARSEQFYTTAWGLEVAARQGSSVYLRATGRDHHVLALHPHPTAEIFSVTFRAPSMKIWNGWCHPFKLREVKSCAPWHRTTARTAAGRLR